MYFGNYGLRKALLDKRLKRNVLEEPFTDNVLNGPKYCFNLDGGTFTIITGQRESS